MFPLICVVVVVLVGMGFRRLLPAERKRRQQIRFIRETLAADRTSDNRRVIASLSTVPDLINNLRPTIRSLLKQTRPADEFVVTITQFSIREKRPYFVPKYLLRLPRVRILHCVKDWGPATKFIPVVQEELAAGRGSSLIVVVDDDRIYPRDALETYLHYSKQLPDAALCFRGAAMPQSMDWRDAKMIRASELRQPRPAAVITGCGSYFIQPRFFYKLALDYSNAPSGESYMDYIW